jgi:hypothetical protein
MRLLTQSPYQQNSEIAFFVAAEKIPASRPVKQPKYAIWVAPFGDAIHVKHEKVIPTITNKIGGALVAFDYHKEELLLGTAVGYAYNFLHYGQNLGHGKVQEELACFYSSYKTPRVWFNAALWGGAYELSNLRRSLGFIDSKASTNGWILSPHIELALDYYHKMIKLEPFVRFDWSIAWQRHYSEKGISGFNLVMDGYWASLLQSELGVRMYQTLHYGWGRFLLEEKLGYVNQAPFHFKNVNTLFVGSISTFPVATGSKKVQNLGSVQLSSSFLPKNHAYPYGMINLEAQLGKNFQSYFVSLEVGKKF